MVTSSKKALKMDRKIGACGGLFRNIFRAIGSQSFSDSNQYFNPRSSLSKSLRILCPAGPLGGHLHTNFMKFYMLFCPARPLGEDFHINSMTFIGFLLRRAAPLEFL